MPLTAGQGLRDAPPGQSYPAGLALGNSLGGHEGPAPAPDRLQGVRRSPGDPGPAPATLPAFPPARQTAPPPWKPPQGSLQPPGQGYLPFPEPPPQNASYAVPQPAVGLFQAGPHQGPPQPAGLPNPTPAPLTASDAPGAVDLQSAFHSVAWQSPGTAAPRQGPPSQEHFYLQPLGTGYGLGHPPTQENNPAAQPQAAPEAGAGQCPAEADSGTVAMFFKGDEAENEEILSSGKFGHVGQADSDPFQQSVGHTYYQPLYTQQAPPAAFSEGPASLPPPAEAQQKGADAQQPPRTACGPHDIPAHKAPALGGEGEAALAEPRGPLGPPYENVENLECVQNQEVPPRESLPHPSMSPAAVSESYRRASLSGPPLPTNSSAGRMEGGPNLEAPDSLPRPVRPDSVSSSYSSLSPRSAPSAVRPQEPGTFIQQESGRPEEESSARFFKQVDSSPLGPAGDPNLSRSYHGGLSQAPTPSPPKPTGVFQTSANSSFEPVRSHGLVAKPAEVDQAKMVVELAESQAHRRSSKQGPGVPVASPGNLEQPPDNLETLFMPQARPLPLTAAGSALPPGGGALLESVPSTPEKRPSARAQGAVKQCESPATTLWASNELPNFGGNVLLAPAAPAVYVPAKQTAQVVQPPDEGLPSPRPPPSKPGSAFLPPPMAGNAPSENLENPPKAGDDEALGSQASSGYASLLSSPPTEALQNQPVLIAQPHRSPPSAQPAHFPLLNPANQHDASRLAQDPGLGSQPLLGLHSGSAPSGEKALLPVAQPGSLLPTPLAAAASATVLQGGSASLLVPPASQLPLSLAPEGPKAAASPGFADKPGAATSSLQSNASPALAPPAGSAAPPGNHGRLTESAKAQEPPGALDFTVAKAHSEHSGQGQGQPFPAGLGFPSLALPAAGQAEPEAHSPQRFYEQEDAYGRYDPGYPQYNGSSVYADPGDYQYMEPERPSSRASHTSDRPSSRQGYPEDYYGAKGGWAEYYAAYYANQPDYGDPGRYTSAHAARFRDPRAYDPQYWYDADQGLYPKREAYASSHHRYDPWQYDPRSAGSFDDDLEPRRDPYGDDFDRRSVHSEHSGHSLRSSHSRQSSFSSRSQQSQLYRSNHDLTGSAYDVAHQPASLHTEYSYGGYAHFDSQPPFTDYGYAANGSWPAAEQVPSRPLTPEKFSVPHVCARFGPGGFLIKVLANLPSEGQPALVELRSMEVSEELTVPRCAVRVFLLPKQTAPWLASGILMRFFTYSVVKGQMMMQHSLEQEEMRAFPGPLTKDDTHKVDVINFAQNKATRCSQNEALIDKESARLLWDFVVLLCRQNGTVVGTDIAELLLQDHKTVWLPGKSPNEANLIDFTNEALEQAEQEESGEAQLSFLTESHPTAAGGLEKETERFRELLLYGRKKDALESAMKQGLWGHALLLASKMDSRTHARVMTRFANSLPINDPLQTVYQLMSGRMPAASTCCGDEKWGDWRPHLAMVLSNVSNGLEVELRTITTMGDTLASKGLLDAAHFCYLMAQVGFGVYTKKTTKLVLIGSNHSLPFAKFATNEAIRRTEAYEYAQSLGTQPCALPNFQVFKFIYACRLAEVGLAAQAFHYCEVIGRAVLQRPWCYSPVLISQLAQVSSQLRLFDPQLKEKPEQELFVAPDWLVQLQNLDRQIREGSVAYSAGRSTPQQFACSSPASEPEPGGLSDAAGAGQETGAGTDNPLLAPLLPMQSVQLMPSAPPAFLDGSAATLPSSQPEPVGGAVSLYPASPPTAGAGPGLPYPPGAEQPPMYLGAALAPAGPPPQPNGLQSQEQSGPEAALQGLSRDSPAWKAAPEEDFYGKMASMGSGRRSRSSSQSSAHMGYGRRSRTTSESSVHSAGRERQASGAPQPSPPPPPIPEGKEARKGAQKEPAPRKVGRPRCVSRLHLPPGPGGPGAAVPLGFPASRFREADRPKWHRGGAGVAEPGAGLGRAGRSVRGTKVGRRLRLCPQSGASWFDWLRRRGRNEAHLPDDKNKSVSALEAPPPVALASAHKQPRDSLRPIVWDGQKQRWVNLDEPEEESKPPPPPPMGFPQAPQAAAAAAAAASGSGAPPTAPVNRFSRRAAGSRARYVDILNPSGAKSPGAAPAPSDLFAPLAPMPIPAGLLVPDSAVEEQQPPDGQAAEDPGTQSAPEVASALPAYLNSAVFPPGSEFPPSNPDGSQPGELSRSSSMSSLSREVSRHFHQPSSEGPPAGTVQFYNPSQFAQSCATPGSTRLGRIGQRKYPTLK
ncbi:hypothetical protein lerEdw1_009339 [Lerista edwardsae]|nr:hypothetical protein lerEdw1_009339 [Lerista edwardsae]